MSTSQGHRSLGRSISLTTCLPLQSLTHSFYYISLLTTYFLKKIIRKQTSSCRRRRAVVRLVQPAVPSLFDSMRVHDLPVDQQRVLGLFKAIVEMRLDVNAESRYPVYGLLKFIRSFVLFAVLQTLRTERAQEQGKKQVQNLMWSEKAWY